MRPEIVTRTRQLLALACYLASGEEPDPRLILAILIDAGEDLRRVVIAADGPADQDDIAHICNANSGHRARKHIAGEGFALTYPW